MDEFITKFADSAGYLGVALLMVLENVFPPIPSEVVMPTAGAAARAGESSFIGVVLAGTLGSIIGALPWYGAGYWIGTERLKAWMERHGHWLGTDASEIEAVDNWFDSYGYWAVLIGRLVPGIRTLISVPAGLAEMPFVPFLLATTLGTAVWTALLAGVGYWLEGRSDAITSTLKYIGVGVIGLMTLLYLARIIHHKAQKARTST